MTHAGPKGIVQFRFDHKSKDMVYVVGDFNQWDEKSHPMEQIGEKWILITQLPPGEYKFKYKTGETWFQDQYPDKFVGFGDEETSVIIVD
jgi:1,4-alpha-glucan branching enzyme